MTKEGEGVTVYSEDLAGKIKKPTGTSNEDWEMDLKAASTIQLCLVDEVMYNVMDEEMTTEL